MSGLAKLFSKWDNRRLARVGDPVRYRQAVQESLAAAERFKVEPSEEDLVIFFDKATDAICRAGRGNDDAVFRQIYKAFVADYSATAFKDLLPLVMDRFYNREERSTENVWILLIAAAFAMDRERQLHGLLRMTSRAWWRASSKRKFARNWLRASYARKNPVSTVYVETVRKVDQPAVGVPSYRGW